MFGVVREETNRDELTLSVSACGGSARVTEGPAQMRQHRMGREPCTAVVGPMIGARMLPAAAQNARVRPRL